MDKFHHQIQTSTDTWSFNLLWLEWSMFSMLVFTFGILVLNYSELIPSIFHRVVKYGKSANVKSYTKLKSLWYLFEIPKSYFYHFYAFALLLYINLAIAASIVYFNVEYKYLNKTKFTQTIKFLLDKFATNTRHATVAPESVMIGLGLLIFQVTRRLYECTRLSVYSNARMNIIHYMFGYSFYFGVGMSILAEAPGFSTKSSLTPWQSPNKYEFFELCHVIGICLFLFSSYMQFDSHRILANLRKDTSGKVITHQHTIPKGRWFNLVSSPHYTAEILIYLSIAIVMEGRSSTWWMVFLFVVINQLMVGKFNHSWYLSTFKDYPKTRKAVVPFVF